MIDRLDGAGLLPAITFIFTRAGCDAAVGQCVRAGLRLTTEDERAEIRRTVERRTAELPQADLAVLGYWEWREALERGIAAHHAGLLPAFKETVEELFVRGLVRAVFATETLALGINMPARTVVLERLVKFNGEGHADLTPGEYTQLTGRAGRRGIDVEGHAVVVWQPGVDPEQVAGLASTRTYPLRSSFRPSYNMAVNLVGRLGIDAARELLEQSFAQFQADRSVVGLARRIERNAEALAGYAGSMRCHLGDFAEYAALRRRIAEREKALSREGTRRRGGPPRGLAARAAARRRHRGAQRPPGRAGRGARPRPRARRARPAPAGAHRGPLGRAAVHGRLPGAGRAARPDAAAQAGRPPRPAGPPGPGVRAAQHRHPRAGPAAPRRRGGAGDDAELATLRRALRAHPCHGCADREAHARWADRHARLDRETEQLRQKVRATTHSLARAFDRIRGLLGERGYLDGRAGHRRPGRSWPGCGASPTCWPPSACARARGTGWSRPSWPPWCRRWCSSRAGRTGRCPGCRPARCPRRWPAPCGSGPSWRPTSAGTGSTGPGSPISASPGRCTAGRAASRCRPC